MIIQQLKNKFFAWLEQSNRKRIIMDRLSSEPYLERYYVFLKDRTEFPFNIFIHKFLKSDPDDVHDHPWPYITLILKGGYYEWVPKFNSYGEQIGEKRFWRRVGHFRFSYAHSFHRIELKEGVECWTLFIPGKQQREWGFLVDNSWIKWNEYLQLRKSTNNSN